MSQNTPAMIKLIISAMTSCPYARTFRDGRHGTIREHRRQFGMCGLFVVHKAANSTTSAATIAAGRCSTRSLPTRQSVVDLS